MVDKINAVCARMPAPVDGVFDQASVDECWRILKSYCWKLDKYGRGTSCANTYRVYQKVMRERDNMLVLREVTRIVTANVGSDELEEEQDDDCEMDE